MGTAIGGCGHPVINRILLPMLAVMVLFGSMELMSVAALLLSAPRFG